MCVLGSLRLAAEGSILCRLKENVGGSVKRQGCVTYSVRHVSRLQRCYSLHHNLLKRSSGCCECKELEQECKMAKLSLESDIARPEGDSVIAVRARDTQLSHQITGHVLMITELGGDQGKHLVALTFTYNRSRQAAA